MKVKLYQLAPEKDKYNLMFMNYEFTKAHQGIHPETYELVFDGELDVKFIDSIFQIFNVNLPEGYRGRSMSVSDIIWAEGLGTFFCDCVGYKQLKVDMS